MDKSRMKQIEERISTICDELKALKVELNMLREELELEAAGYFDDLLDDEDIPPYDDGNNMPF